MRFFMMTLLTAVSAAGIYPDDHWDYSTKIKSHKQFDELVKQEVDAGRNLMAPAWNDVVKEFKDEASVTFADIVLREAPIRGPPHNPGQGGWPTIRYFNKDTGYSGQSYVKKTSDAMCTELGPGKKYMSEYVKDVISGNGPGMAEMKEKEAKRAARKAKYAKKEGHDEL